MLQWKWRTFQELSNQELYDVLALRQSVFIVEQQCPYPDLDFKDQLCKHLLGFDGQSLAAYLRLLPKDNPYQDAISFGRVATATFARGKGYGKEMMNQILLYLKQHDNNLPIIISAQMYLEKFYQSFGFTTISEPYDEDWIPHIKMKRA
jgi:ElaA protein